jgi:hypothetical protein
MAFTLIQAGSLVYDDFTMHYLFFSIVEISTTMFITWAAWNWRNPETFEMQQNERRAPSKVSA